MRFSTLAQLATLATVALGHPGEVHEPLSPAEISRLSVEAERRNVAARSCAGKVDAFNNQRRAKRSLGRRDPERKHHSEASSTSSAAEPHYTSIQNFTCVVAPEVTEGPYYINNEMVRGNLIEDQPGVPLVLDIGLIDIETCEPLPNAFVEIWASNATGIYGGYPAQLDPNQPFPTGGPDEPIIPLVRNETFLRGGLATDKNGMVELTTIYPGFYEQRTVHVHTMIHVNYETSPNGTIISHAGNMIHIGQIFFEESWNDLVVAEYPYTENTNPRTLNTEDMFLPQQASGGYDAYAALEMLGESVSDGILGYITIGVNASASYDIHNTNYLNASITASPESISSVSETPSSSSYIARALGF